MERYLLDTNVFIQSFNTLPIDIFPSYWAKLAETITSGTGIIHESVFNELKKHKDPLLDWMKSLEGLKVLKSSDKTLQCYLAVCSWAGKDGRYSAQALREFKRQGLADAWLCAEAVASGLVIATHETKSNSPNRVKIPDACAGVGAKCVSYYDFMRSQGFKF